MLLAWPNGSDGLLSSPMSGTSAITIGNFDGVHLGHVELVAAARQAVGASGRVIALSFDPHPLTVLRPDKTPKRLTTFQQRQDLLTKAGADEVVPLRPTGDFLKLEAQEFLEWITSKYKPDFIVEGEDFHFARARQGNIKTVIEGQAKYGYSSIIIETVKTILTDHSIVRASSSMVRWLIERGRVRDASILLDRPFELCCEIVSGDKRGRDLGVPTANLNHLDYALPEDGIYCGFAIADDGKRYAAAISVGTKPTFGKHPRLCEAHLLDYQGDLDHYGWTIKLQFHDWIRDQLKFNSVELLVEQLKRDINKTRKRCDMNLAQSIC
ncbi:MAG: riboflavin biosynthesis protein RibF [Planctomycetes bacterium]|nr:riboflavin biosynthesis protein RibF [Planctomycetota bacterium]